jgi:hypothetical protein
MPKHCFAQRILFAVLSAADPNRVAVRGRHEVYSNAVMKCPFCRMDNDRVIDSRSSQDGLAIRRRR